MKTLMQFWTTAAIVLAFLSGTPSPTVAQERLRVLATTPDLASIARMIGGDRVEVEAVARAGQNPHDVTATPAMVAKISRAHLFIENGLELEVGWVPALLQSARNASVRPGGAGYVDASFRVAVLDVPAGPVIRAMGDVHGSGNPHYTLDPIACKRAAWNIANGLIRIDPSRQEEYVERLRVFYARADAAVARARETSASLRGAPIIVYHPYYRYLTSRLGMVEVASIEPVPGVPPSASHLARLIANQKDKGVRLVLIEPWNDRRIAERVARELGARVVQPLTTVGTGASDVLEMFEKNVALLAEGLR